MSTHSYWNSKADVVQFVLEELRSLKHDSVLIMTIKPEKSVGFSVISATEELSEDIETLHSLKQPTNI